MWFPTSQSEMWGTLEFGELRTMRPDLTKIDWKPAAAKTTAHEADEWFSPEHIALKSFYTHEDLEGLEHLEYAAGHCTVPARALHHDVCHAAVDHPAICGFFDGGGVECVLPAQPGGGAAGAFGGVRSGDAPRLRLRPRARDGRRGQSGRGHRFDSRHEASLPPHSAGADVGVDDDERRSAADHGVLYRGRRGAGRAAGAVERNHPERHSERVHGPQHLHLSARGIDARSSATFFATARKRCRSSTASA